MQSMRSQARRVGLLYFVSGLTAPFGLIYVPRMLIVPGDATATAGHVRASETLLRLGIAGELIAATMFLFVALAVYRLFKDVSAHHARAMVVLYAVSVPISFANVLNEVAALLLVRGATFLSVFEPRQLDAMALLFLRLHGQGLVLAEVFWGLWLLPFGVLVVRSRFVPRILGAWLIVNGLAYVAASATTLLLPRYASMVSRVTFPLLFGEMAMMLWLMIAGVKPRQPEVASA